MDLSELPRDRNKFRPQSRNSMAELFLHVPGIEPRPSSPVLGHYWRSGTTNGVSITEIYASEPGIVLR